MQPTLLATKLHLPGRPSRQIRRPQLVQRLNQGLEAGHILTLVSAPAGFGKTCSVAAWLEGLDLPAAWLSLDASDDDPSRFFSYLLAALQQIDPRIGKELAGAFVSGQSPGTEAIAAALINDIDRLGRRFVLVLDDFHLIQEASIQQVLGGVLTACPAPLHLVLVTREDPLLPLSRLRANGRMSEIRAADLRFSTGEIDRFLKETLGLALSEPDLTALEARTEGWAVGLQLVGMSMHSRPDPSAFIAHLSGSHRFILGYLTEEILSRQPEEIRSFLLQSSILERLNGDLCDALTGRTDSALLLERLLAANLFISPLDDEQRWYRYHPLFADLLRALLNHSSRGGEAMILHRRAAGWYAAAGMIAEAIEHAIAAGDYPQAAEWIDRHAMNMTLRGYVKTVERWMEAVPTQWRSKSPRAYLAFASMHLMRGHYSQVARQLELAEAAIFPGEEEAGEKNRPLQAEWLALRANLLNVSGSAEESLRTAQRALQAALPEDDYLLGIAYLGLGGAYRLYGDYPHLVEAYQQAMRHSRAAASPLPEVLSATALSMMALQQGELSFAGDVASEVITHFEASGSALPPVAGSVYGVLGMVHYEWNRLESARSDFDKALQLSLLGGHNAGVVFARVLLSRLALALGDLQGAGDEIREAALLLPQGVPAWLKPEVFTQQVQVELALGNISAVQGLLEAQQIPEQGVVPGLPQAHSVARLRLALLLAREKNSPHLLAQEAETADRLVVAAGETGALLQALLLRARVHALLYHTAAAGEDLGQALAWAEPRGYLRSFVDEGPELAALLAHFRDQTGRAGYVDRLLEALPRDGSPATGRTSLAEKEAASWLVEPLTERELEVLHLFAEGLKYEQTAERLFISLNTVRFYVKSIYGKLQVNNRVQAIETARRLGLI